MAPSLRGFAADSSRAWRRGDERATGSLGPRAEGAAPARRWLPRSHGGRAGREGCGRGGRAPRRPAPWARGGAGSALGGPPSPAAAAAAPLRL